MLYKLALLFLFLPSPSAAHFYYDTEKNETSLAGPFIDYNFDGDTIQLSNHQFFKKDFNIELSNKNLLFSWPSLFSFVSSIQFIEISNSSEKIIYTEELPSKSINKTPQFTSKKNGIFEKTNKDSLYKFCLEKLSEDYRVKVCSEHFYFTNGEFKKMNYKSQKKIILLNGSNSPISAQMQLEKNKEDYNLEVKSDTGYYFFIKEIIPKIDASRLIIDLKKKRLGIRTDKDQKKKKGFKFWSYFKEKNTFLEKSKLKGKWLKKINDEEFIFTPSPNELSLIAFGFSSSLPSTHTNLQSFKKNPKGTYRPKVKLKLKKEQNFTVDAPKLTVSKKDENLIEWTFNAPIKGAFNYDSVRIIQGENSYYKTKQLYRAYPGSVSVSSMLSASPTLDVVAGYNISAEYWLERVFNDNPYQFQRFGFRFNLFETLNNFKPKEQFLEEVSIQPLYFDLLYRFKPGVKPLISSFGLGLRYLDYKYTRTVSKFLNPQFLGMGLFWHTGPQKIVDDVFGIVPWFRYPKWMELSLFYYPFIIGDFDLGFTWSYHAKGKLYFSKKWFFEASINLMNVNFKKNLSSANNISTVYGTLGLGVNF